MQPVVCMVTDRSRLQPPARIGSAQDTAIEDLLVERVGAAARAGVHLVQVRERDLDGGPLLRLVRRCLDAVRDTSTRIVVNDRLDVALAAGAHGVHLRGDSMPAARVRPLVAAGFLIGRSVHGPVEARLADREGCLDYLVFGPVFATVSKPGLAPAGLDALISVVGATRLPVLAIGGVTAATAVAIGQSGAAGFAAIGLFAGREDELRASLPAARAGFASVRETAG